MLGHLTLPLRYINENLGEVDGGGHFDQCRNIPGADQAAAASVQHQPGAPALPDAPLLEALPREQGGEIITLGSGAHSAGGLLHPGAAGLLRRVRISLISPRSRRQAPVPEAVNVQKENTTMKIAIACDRRLR